MLLLAAVLCTFPYSLWNSKVKRRPAKFVAYKEAYYTAPFFYPRRKIQDKMKYIIYLYTGMFSGIDSDKPEELQDCLRGKLQKEAIVKNTNDILADEHDFRKELRGSDCVVLVGSGQASFLIQNQQQETEDGLIIFDGKVIHEEFTENRKLVEKLIMVFFTEKNKNDWIPTGMDEKRIFRLKGEKIWEGNPALDHLEYTIRRVLGETVLDW